MVGGSVSTVADGLEIVICRNDNWNEKGGQKAVAAVRVTSPGFDWSDCQEIRQTCCLARAEILIEWVCEGQRSTLCVFAPRGHEVVMVRAGGHEIPWQAVVVPALENDESRTAGGWSGIHHVNADSVFAEGNRRVGLDESFQTDPLLGRRWAVVVPNDSPGRWMAVGTASLDAASKGDAWQVACESASNALKDPEWYLDEHRAWWAGFWNRSRLAMHSGSGDAEYEERLWYTNLYFLGSACGGKYPPRFNGGLFLLDPAKRDWDYGYWFQNMREIYWPLFAAGHAEWSLDFFRMYVQARDYVRAQTKNVHGWSFPAYPETMSFWGWSPDTDLQEKTSAPGIHHNYSSNLEVCLLMEWYARWSGDSDFRRETLYPFLKNAVGLFQDLAEMGNDGFYHFAPCNALEVWVDAIDPAQDLAGLRVLVPLLIQMGRDYGADSRELDRWEAFRGALPPLPVGRWVLESRSAEGIHTFDDLLRVEPDADGTYLPAGGLVGTNRRRGNMENAELYAVFPWGLIPKPGDSEDARRVERTWQHRTWKRRNNGWSQDVPQLARMGRGDWAAEASLEHAAHNQRFPNGGFICPGSPRFHGLLTPHLYLDSAGVHLAGLAEMCLQSFDGVIRIAPALPRDWNVGFVLHTLDGFLVEADVVGGKAVFAKVQNPRGPRPVTVRNTREKPMRVCNTGETVVVEPGADFSGMLAHELTLDWGETYSRMGGADGPERDGIMYPSYKVKPPPVCFPSGHWHDERGGHGQIGLAEDGLFPAIRPA